MPTVSHPPSMEPRDHTDPPGTVGYVIRELRNLGDFAQVFELEQRVWGLSSGDDAVPVHVMVATVKCGALVLGARDAAGTMVGFAYSFFGRRYGELLHWSHILGVLPEHRGRGVARQLKFAQRDHVLRQGLGLIAWTFDPMQVENAHLNFTVLGATSSEYLRDVYGSSESPLHRGVATDRLVVEWRLDSPAVRARAGAAPESGTPGASRAATPAPRPDAWINDVRPAGGGWLAWEDAPRPATGAGRPGLRVPPRFTDMLREAPSLALDWRSRAREAFEAYLARGFVVDDFVRDGDRGGYYVFTRKG